MLTLRLGHGMIGEADGSGFFTSSHNFAPKGIGSGLGERSRPIGSFLMVHMLAVQFDDVTSSIWTGLIERIDPERRKPRWVEGSGSARNRLLPSCARSKSLALACKEAGISELNPRTSA